MIDDKKFRELLTKLDKCLLHQRDGTEPSVSPTPKMSGWDSSHPGILFKDMPLSVLTKEELMMIHANLHRFYPRGIGELKKQDIEKLHAKVRIRIKHHDFDQLDRNDKNE